MSWTHCAREDRIFLEEDRYRSTQVGEPECADVQAVDENFAFGHIMHPRDKSQNGALP